MAKAERVLTASVKAPIAANAVDYLRQAIDRSFSPARVDFTADQVSVVLEGEPGQGARARDLQQLLDRLVHVSETLDEDLIFERSSARGVAPDPTPVLAERGEVVRIAPGLYAFTGPFLALVRQADALFAGLATAYGAHEADVPPLWPVEMFRATHHFHTFPQATILCAEVRPDYRSRRAFAKAQRKGDPYRRVPLDHTFAPARLGLQTMPSSTAALVSVGLAGATDVAYTTVGKVFTEADGSTGLAGGLKAITVRSIMASGSEAFVNAAKETWLDDLVVFAETLDLELRIEASSDPVFGSQGTLHQVFQRSSRLKYDLRARLPYAGQFLTIGSVSLHLDALGRAFHKVTPDGGHPFAACMSLALEPLIFVLHAQYGMDLERWPTGARAALGIEAPVSAETVKAVWG